MCLLALISLLVSTSFISDVLSAVLMARFRANCIVCLYACVCGVSVGVVVD